MPEECLHGLPVDYCARCRARAQGLPQWVHVTGAGHAFHVREDCQALHAGWAKARRFGKENTELRRIEVVDALARGLGACEQCCGHLYPQPPRAT